MELNKRQLELISTLNNKESIPECPHGCLKICRRATQAATHLLAGREPEVAQEYPDCPNASIVTALIEDILNAGRE